MWKDCPIKLFAAGSNFRRLGDGSAPRARRMVDASSEKGILVDASSKTKQKTSDH